MLERINSVLNVVIIAVAAVVLFRPGGPVARMISEYRAEAELRERVRQEWTRLEDTPSRLGSQQAQVRLVEFSDYQCPFCRQAHGVVEDFIAHHPAIGVAYRHFPILRVHPLAEEAATAAVCAEEQGRFQSMHAWLMETERWQHSPDWRIAARAAGVPDTARFSRCLESREAAARLREDMGIAERLGVRSTPTFVYEGGVYRGVPSVADLEEVLGIPSSEGPEGADGSR